MVGWGGEEEERRRGGKKREGEVEAKSKDDFSRKWNWGGDGRGSALIGRGVHSPNFHSLASLHRIFRANRSAANLQFSR